MKHNVTPYAEIALVLPSVFFSPLPSVSDKIFHGSNIKFRIYVLFTIVCHVSTCFVKNDVLSASHITLRFKWISTIHMYFVYALLWNLLPKILTLFCTVMLSFVKLSRLEIVRKWANLFSSAVNIWSDLDKIANVKCIKMYWTILTFASPCIIIRLKYINLLDATVFTSLLLDVYVWLNMFRAPLRPSSGAYNCTRSLWFYRWKVAVAALLVVDCQILNLISPTNNALILTMTSAGNHKNVCKSEEVGS
jgi:hypothetical protein